MGSHVRQIQGDKNILKTPVLAGTTVDERPDNIGRERAQGGDHAGVDVENEDGMAEVT